jgi:hypothetical protein
VIGGNWIDYGTEDDYADSANDIGAAKKKRGNGERGGDRKNSGEAIVFALQAE